MDDENAKKNFRLGYFSRRKQMGEGGEAEHKSRKHTKRDRFDIKREKEEDEVEKKGRYLLSAIRTNPSLSPARAGAAVDTAQELMRIGHNSGVLKYSLLGANLYDALGRGDSHSVQNRLYRDVKGAIQETKNRGYKPEGFDEEIDEARAFFNRHNRKSNSLSGRLTIIAFVASSFILSAAFALNSFTGYAIAEVSPTSSNFFGVLFFLLGIVGSFILLKGN